jgi:hypothetical protein
MIRVAIPVAIALRHRIGLLRRFRHPPPLGPQHVQTDQ